jgi:hypothetical protein
MYHKKSSIIIIVILLFGVSPYVVEASNMSLIITLVVPGGYCGDGICDPWESCGSCPEDCGPCPVGGGGSIPIIEDEDIPIIPPSPSWWDSDFNVGTIRTSNGTAVFIGFFVASLILLFTYYPDENKMVSVNGGFLFRRDERKKNHGLFVESVKPKKREELVVVEKRKK